MTNDLISRSALKADLLSKGVLPAVVSRAIDRAPAITPESLVRHGRWETSGDTEEIMKDFACSICGEVLCDFDTEVCWPGQNCYFFCPNCGAKMDLEE